MTSIQYLKKHKYFLFEFPCKLNIWCSKNVSYTYVSILLKMNHGDNPKIVAMKPYNTQSSFSRFSKKKWTKTSGNKFGWNNFGIEKEITLKKITSERISKAQIRSEEITSKKENSLNKRTMYWPRSYFR